MSSDFEALVAGHICLDIHPDLVQAQRMSFTEAFSPGRLINAGPVTFSTGGAVSNTGLALIKLGIRVRLIGKIGDDLFGQAVRQIVTSTGGRLSDGMISDPASNTSYTIIVNYPGVDRIFIHFPGANDTFRASDVPEALLEQVRLFHFGYPPLMRGMYQDGGIQLEEIFRRAKQAGATTSLDMAFPDQSSEAGRADWPAILKRVLPWVDLFLPSVEETLIMFRRSAYQEMLRPAGGSDVLSLVAPGLLEDLGRELVGLGPKMVGLKLGARGFYLRTGSARSIRSMGRAQPSSPRAWAEREFWAPCFKVEVAGTTGSGDATVAGFLSGLLRDQEIEAALTSAVAVGACNVESTDALSGIRSWEETARRIHAGWDRLPLTLSAPGWSWDQESGLWRGPCA
jgi:sugar/nucleoside kinase (ribokinase family)